MKTLSKEDLHSGRYQIRVQVRDRVLDQFWTDILDKFSIQ